MDRFQVGRQIGRRGAVAALTPHFARRVSLHTTRVACGIGFDSTSGCTCRLAINSCSRHPSRTLLCRLQFFEIGTIGVAKFGDGNGKGFSRWISKLDVRGRLLQQRGRP